MTIGTTIFVPKFLNNYTFKHCMRCKHFKTLYESQAVYFVLRLPPSVSLCLEFAFVRDVGSGRSYPTKPISIELMQYLSDCAMPVCIAETCVA